MKEVWKKFDQVELTHSSVHHLMAMQDLLNKNGYVRGVDIANFLNISRSSVSITLRKLIAKGYVREDENKFFHFEDTGKDLVDSVLHKRSIIKKFFSDALGLTEELAEAEACKVEHLLEEETSHRLLSFMGYFLSGQKPAKAFINGLNKFTPSCEHHEECNLCESECYFAGKNKK